MVKNDMSRKRGFAENEAIDKRKQLKYPTSSFCAQNIGFCESTQQSEHCGTGNIVAMFIGMRWVRGAELFYGKSKWGI